MNGRLPGAKNVTGGRLYVNPCVSTSQTYGMKLLESTTNELLTMMSSENSTTIRFRSEKFNRPPYHSYTVLRATFDRWLASRAEEAGAMLVTKNLVDDIIKENGRVIGVVAGGEELGADVVIACDGALSLITEKAGLRSPGDPKNYAVGLKEVIELPRETLEDRFGLTGDEGVAQLFMGSLTQGCFGGGFLYTNKSSISLGMVVGIKDLMEKKPPAKYPTYWMISKSAEIAALIRREQVEYWPMLSPKADRRSYNSIQ